MRLKPAGYRPILTFKNEKTVKGEKYGYKTGIVYLAPANESGKANLCPYSTKGCRKDCLFTAGHGRYGRIRQARIDKTLFYLTNPELFKECLKYDIEKLEKYCSKNGMKPVVRVNGTSDIPKLAQEMARTFPNVQFMDYTKIPKPWNRTLENYHLTFSHSENNIEDCIESLRHGINVAVVFDTKRGEPLPETWHGFRVVDGDTHDLRFLNEVGTIVGLRAKGRAIHDKDSGFVIESNPNHLHQIEGIYHQITG